MIDRTRRRTERRWLPLLTAPVHLGAMVISVWHESDVDGFRARLSAIDATGNRRDMGGVADEDVHGARHVLARVAAATIERESDATSSPCWSRISFASAADRRRADAQLGAQQPDREPQMSTSCSAVADGKQGSQHRPVPALA